jgi:hypothetical protein
LLFPDSDHSFNLQIFNFFNRAACISNQLYCTCQLNIHYYSTFYSGLSNIIGLFRNRFQPFYYIFHYSNIHFLLRIPVAKCITVLIEFQPFCKKSFKLIHKKEFYCRIESKNALDKGSLSNPFLINQFLKYIFCGFHKFGPLLYQFICSR